MKLCKTVNYVTYFERSKTAFSHQGTCYAWELDCAPDTGMVIDGYSILCW